MYNIVPKNFFINDYYQKDIGYLHSYTQMFFFCIGDQI